MHVIQETKIGKNIFFLKFFSQYLERLHSTTTIEMEILPTRINEELNASTIDFQQMTKDGIL